MNLPTIPESIYAAAWRRWLQSGEDDCRPLLAECLDAVWPDLYALAVALGLAVVLTLAITRDAAHASDRSRAVRD